MFTPVTLSVVTIFTGKLGISREPLSSTWVVHEPVWAIEVTEVIGIKESFQWHI